MVFDFEGLITCKCEDRHTELKLINIVQVSFQGKQLAIAQTQKLSPYLQPKHKKCHVIYIGKNIKMLMT